ncbi:hypothetical protein Tco_0272130 [Tanacetum coccineum]
MFSLKYDYGPIPFRFYRYWLEVDGFDKLVRDSWNVAPVNKKNAIRNFMEELRSCDEVIDKGDCSNEVVHKHTEILNKIHQVNNIQASEIAQKAKIKWAIERDENMKSFHGMLNKKRSQSNIRGSITFVADKQIRDGPFILEESKIMGVNVEDGMVKNAASKLGCLVLKTPFTYLGTKVGGNMSRKQAWKEVVDKVLSRLSRWKMKLLSIGGRLTLLKSVLGSMPIFHMSIFKVPSSILKSLESIRSRFFNGQDPKSNKASWVKWNKVLTPKDKGGLGVSSLFALNRGLMLKWVWRFYSQKCSLWTKVIKAIYGEDGNLNKDVSGGVRTCWTSIVHEVRVLQGRGINVADYIRLKPENGENKRFWVDNCRDSTNSLAEISRMTTLCPCEDRYFLTLENDDLSVSSFRKEIDGNRFQDVSFAD